MTINRNTTQDLQLNEIIGFLLKNTDIIGIFGPYLRPINETAVDSTEGTYLTTDLGFKPENQTMANIEGTPPPKQIHYEFSYLVLIKVNKTIIQYFNLKVSKHLTKYTNILYLS